MLASAAKQICSSVSFARATLGTNLEDIVAKEKVRSCQRENVSIGRGFAIGELQLCGSGDQYESGRGRKREGEQELGII